MLSSIALMFDMPSDGLSTACSLPLQFRPLWTRNSPRFGLAHALCLGLAPWLAAEVPWMAGKGVIAPTPGAT